MVAKPTVKETAKLNEAMKEASKYSSAASRDVSKPGPQKDSRVTTTSRPLTTRRQRSLDAFDYSDWKSWTDILKSIYPKTKFSSMAHTSFFTTFRSTNLGPLISGPLLPPELFQKFITEFSQTFQSDIPIDGTDSFERSEIILWKDILRQENINLKFDYATDKKIRAGLVNFITTNATPRHLPSGNSSRQYFIPKELGGKFLEWFKDHSKTGFRDFEVKRKSSSLNDNSRVKKAKVSAVSEPVPHQVLTLDVDIGQKEELELIPATE
jgi:hypothetical protein